MLLRRERNESAPQVPLLVKIAPDLSKDDMRDIASVLTNPETRFGDSEYTTGIIINNIGFV
jgi:dihydroorotate dehydrogenase